MDKDKRELGQHISRQYDHDLEDLRSRVLSMGGLVEQQLADALSAMVGGDTRLARQVVDRDYQVNALEVALDEQCSHILARRQPAAGDLRLIIAVIKTITDLERIGDQAERVARNAIELSEMERPRDKLVVRHMGELARKLLHDSLDAFARMDVDLAHEVTKRDLEIDREYEAFVRQLITYMMEDPRSIRWTLAFLWSARALERIGDHSKNICEYLIYMALGKDIRHTDPQQRAQELEGD